MRAHIAAWLAVVLGLAQRRALPAAPAPRAPLHLVMTPHVEFIRVYDRPDGYEKRLPYIGIMAVTHLTDKVTWLHGAMGEVTRATRAQALDLLRARGITTLLVERHGHLKTIEL